MFIKYINYFINHIKLYISEALRLKTLSLTFPSIFILTSLHFYIPLTTEKYLLSLRIIFHTSLSNIYFSLN